MRKRRFVLAEGTSRSLAAALTLAVMLAMAFGVSSSPARAGAAPAAGRQPDARIRLQKTTSEFFSTETYSRPWIGDNIYNTTAYHQAARETWCCEMPGWQRWIFGVSVQNDGTNSDRIRVNATGTDLEGWTVKYFDGPTNITAAVGGGTFTTPLLAPGAEYTIKVEVRRDADNYDTDNLKRLISLTSVGNSNKVDAVKVVLRHWVCTC